MGFPGDTDGKEPAMQEDPDSIPGSGRSPGEGNGNPLEYSTLENPMDREAWQVQSMESQRVGHDWATNTLSYLRQKLIDMDTGRKSWLTKLWDSGQFFIFLADTVIFQKVEEVSRGTVALTQILVNQAEQADEGKWPEPR